MTKSDLVEGLARRLRHLSRAEVEVIVDAVFGKMRQALVGLKRVELRGFGIFEVRRRIGRRARNPKSGVVVEVRNRYVPFFKSGKGVRERLNAAQFVAAGPDFPSDQPLKAAVNA